MNGNQIESEINNILTDIKQLMFKISTETPNDELIEMYDKGERDHPRIYAKYWIVLNAAKKDLEKLDYIKCNEPEFKPL